MFDEKNYELNEFMKSNHEDTFLKFNLCKSIAKYGNEKYCLNMTVFKKNVFLVLALKTLLSSFNYLII